MPKLFIAALFIVLSCMSADAHAVTINASVGAAIVPADIRHVGKELSVQIIKTRSQVIVMY
ncbi:MAG: hypothetical protein FWF23_01160 [Alphaproteobacteria bacterium]|nr:hypothetical protein [Alphaproteobacteria bacterium]MCL2505882.1 hypothetical protein [Alphaproteobacteria bacterium]